MWRDSNGRAPIDSIPAVAGLLACTVCREPLVPAPEGVRCARCERRWLADGLVLVPERPERPHGGLASPSEAFFDARATVEHRHAPPREGQDTAVDRLSRLASYDHVARVRALARQAVQSRPAETVVVAELGCGEGDNLCAVVEAAAACGTLLGCDVALGALRRAGERLAASDHVAHVALVPTAGGRVPMSDGVADLVLLIHVLHHAGDLALLGEAARIARIGGRVYVVDISGDNPLYRACRAAWRFLPGRVRGRFSSDLCVGGEAPEVRLVSHRRLDAEAQRVGLTLERQEDSVLFLFFLSYAALVVPALARAVPMGVWRALYRLESWALGFGVIASRSAGLARVYVRETRSR